MAISCNTNSLLEASKCYRCITREMLEAVRTYLLCSWVNAGPAPVAPDAPTNLDIDLTSTAVHVVLTWTNGASPGTTNEVWRSKNSGAYALFTTVGGGATTATDVGPVPAGEQWCYEVRACNGAVCSAFTTPACIGNDLNFNATVLAVISLPNLILNLNNFKVEGPASVTTISCPRLELITGTLSSGPGIPNLTSFSMPVLADVQGAGGVLMSVLTNLPSISFPALTHSGAYFALNVSNALVSVTAANLAVVDGLVTVGSNPSQTSFSLPALTSCAGFDASGCTAMTSLSAAAMTTCFGTLTASGNTSLTSVTFTSLANVSNDVVLDNCTSLASVTFPALTTVGQSLTAGSCSALASATLAVLASVGTNITFSSSGLTSLSLPSLATIGGWFQTDTCAAITSITCASLTTVNSFISGTLSTALTSVSFPALVTVSGTFNYNGCSLLTSVNVPVWVISNGTTIDFGNDALDQTSVELILARGVASGVTTCTFELSGGTNTGFAALSPAGQADFATLTGAGNVVNLNP
ncbi:MAG TPA: hypothetical protein VF077_12920 [Nitrospiraceae bacterium]